MHLTPIAAGVIPGNDLWEQTLLHTPDRLQGYELDSIDLPGVPVLVAPNGSRFLIIPGLDDPITNLPIFYPLDSNSYFELITMPAILRHRAAMAYVDGVELKRREIGRCRNGVLGRIYWLATYCAIFEPRGTGQGSKRLPFIPVPRQVQLLLMIEATMQTPPGLFSSLAIEKCRGVGATWIDSADHIWRWQFDPEPYIGLLMSIDEDKVDKAGDPSSWMAKFDYLIKYQPPWLLPPGFNLKSKRCRHHLVLINPHTDSGIFGQSTNVDTGRGDRVNKASVDEGQHNPRFGVVWNLLTETTDHKFVMSTPGLANDHFQYLIQGTNGWPQPRTFRFEWWQYPGHDDAWLRSKQEQMEPSMFRMEYLIEYGALQAESSIFPLAAKIPVLPLQPREDWSIYVSMDDGWDHDTAIGFWQIEPGMGKVECLATYSNRNKPISFYGALLSGLIPWEYEPNAYDHAFVHWLNDRQLTRDYVYTFVGDRHGDNTSMVDGRSAFQVLEEEFGIMMMTNSRKRSTHDVRREAVMEFIPRLTVNAEHDGYRIRDALIAARLEATTLAKKAHLTERRTPVHDNEHSHLRTSAEYLFRYLLDVPAPIYPPTRLKRADEIAEQRLRAMDERQLTRNKRTMATGRRFTGKERVVWKLQ